LLRTGGVPHSMPQPLRMPWSCVDFAHSPAYC
jgi:hypothetical protein